MKIEHVVITNWHPPGEQWWADVESKPDEPLISATMNLTLSWHEYHEMVEKSRSAESAEIQSIENLIGQT
jgi:hypothetical protein